LPRNEDFVLPLSGGRDSRRILLELNALGFKPKFCVTHHQFAPKSDEDLRIARLLCSQLNVPHVVVEQPNHKLFNELRKNLLTNFCTNEHVQILAAADFLQGKTDTIYDGIAGMLAESWLIHPPNAELLHKREYQLLAENLFNQFGPGEDLIKKTLNKKIYERMPLQAAKDHLIAELQRHEEAPNPISSFHFWNR